MLARNLAILLLAIGLCGIANRVIAENEAAPEKDKSLLGRLDSLGKTLFGGILPAEKSKPKDVVAPKIEPRLSIQKPSAGAKPSVLTSARAEAPVELDDELDVPKVNNRRVGSILGGSPETPRSRVENKNSVGDSEEFTPENTPSAIPRSADGTPGRVRRPLADASLLDDSEMSETPETTEQEILAKPTHRVREEMNTGDSPDTISPDTMRIGTKPAVSGSVQPRGVTKEPRKAVEGPSGAAAKSADLPDAAQEGSRPTTRPLHERLSTFRHSAFDGGGTRGLRSESNVLPEQAAETTVTSTAQKSETPSERVDVAQRVRIPVRVAETPAAESAPAPIESAALKIETSPAMVEERPATAEPAPAVLDPTPAEPLSNDEGVLFARKGSILSVETLGPRRISVGKESTYEVSLTNSGEVAAESLVVYVSLPEWAEVVGAEVSGGDAQVNAGDVAGAVHWNVGHLDAKGNERLRLRIVPRQNRPFDLAVRWESKPVGSQAMIEVQEPKLALQLEGPREVLYGKKEVYRLKLANTGNGAAENVAIMLMPIGGGENVPATHRLGSLAAGEEKVLDVELTARQAGNLTIQLDARADGGIHAELAEKVTVRRAGLKIDVEGPAMQFVGTAATYTVRVRNSGTAPARNIQLSAVLPAGSEYLSGIDDARVDVPSGRLAWTIETINPEVEHSFVVKCSLAAAGVCRVQVQATADDDLSATCDAMTRVESVANLSMEVKDPAGPVPVGDEAVYEVCVRNRGTRAAEGIEIFGYFSRGIEPTAAEGGPSRLGPGQVVFQPIASLAPGAEVVLKVHAKADEAGNHVFRAETHCKPLGARLVREATNLYYADASAGTQAIAKHSANEDPATDALRAVMRPVQDEAMVAPPRKQ